MATPNNSSFPPDIHGARIKVVGVGGCGLNAVTRMIEAGLGGVEFIAMNTDAQVLNISPAGDKLQLGEATTHGLGAGGNPDIGRRAADESAAEIRKRLDGAEMVFITAGMGGGTGTGGAPVVAAICQELGILTIGVVTRPFSFEGPRRARIASDGIDDLRSHVDAIIVVPNDRLAIADRKVTFEDAYRAADDILRQGVQGITDMINIPAVQNVDFADVQSIMKGAGTALIGIGIASGDHRAAEAAELAINSPLLEHGMDGATGVLVSYTTSSDFRLEELTEASEIILGKCDPDDANIITGWIKDSALAGEVKITVVATGFGRHRSSGFAGGGAAPPRPADVFQRRIDTGTPASAVAASDEKPAASTPSTPAPTRDEVEVPDFLRRRP
ncbi:MAG: cell division protein FtsZ [Armatimonadetes bacterium]|nr:cell division protein FtsZ [Armatimonadota bacterium]MDE2205224.1 cell division protein FtsZ [Armatimonadota bacterium]